MRKLFAITALAFAACNSSSGSNTVATPTFAPPEGTYATVQNVTITCATAGAVVHYTTDGTTPTATSPAYSSAIAITTTTTLKALATATGKTDSAVASATYTLKAGAPVLSPSAGVYATAQNVTLTSATPSASIHYTTDGTVPDSHSPTYTAAIPLPLGASATTTTIKAIALATGFEGSDVTSGTYVIDPNATPAAAPTFNPPAGTYTSVQSVTISSATGGVSIYYTTDGSTPTTASTLYTAPVQVASNLTIKAIAAGGGHTASTVASAAYVINLPKAATPTFTPGAGTYTATQSVTIGSTTPGAVIYYTTNGSTPTTGSTLYSGPVSVSVSETLKAIATASGYTTSDVGSAAYIINTGGGTDFLTACNSYFNKSVSLLETCLKANPAAVGSSQTFCADTQKEITAGLISYNSTQGAACVSAVNALTCADLNSAGSSAPAACNAALTGTVGTGGTCYSSNDCAAGFCTWELPTGTCPGTCQPFVALGNACTVDAQCGAARACDGGVCKTVQAVNGACPCQAGLWCDTSGGAPGVCKASLAVGASCSVTNDHCTVVARCAGTPATCQSYVGAGAACTTAVDLCGLGYYCDGTSHCASYPTSGQSCATPATPGVCLNSYCDIIASPTAPVCKPLLADGATCNPTYFGTDCASGYCNPSSKCAPDTSSQCVIP